MFDPVLYNTVPGAPKTPWGLQQMAAPLGTNVSVAPGTDYFSPDMLQAPSYSAPPVGAMGPVGVRVAPVKTTPISPYVGSSTTTNAASQQLAYDQQLALSSGNMDAYWQLQSKIDAAAKPTGTVAPVKP